LKVAVFSDLTADQLSVLAAGEDEGAAATSYEVPSDSVERARHSMPIEPLLRALPMRLAASLAALRGA
jgi:hypothetical protein